MSGHKQGYSGVNFYCATCLKESSDPHRCSNCGAYLEEITLENSFFLAPRSLTYFIPFSISTERELLASVEFARAEFFQDFDLVVKSDGLDIKSNDIAKDILIERLCEVQGVSKDDLLRAIISIDG